MGSVEYRDLLIAVWSDDEPGFFRARAEEEFGRRAQALQIYLPFDDRWFVEYSDRLDELNSRELHYVGARLFDSLFRDEILRLYVHLLEQTRKTGARLRIRLKLDAPIVARLPWECLYDTRNATFLNRTPDVTLVRYVQAGKEPRATPARAPLRVLLAGEDHPDGSAHLSVEAKAVSRALAELESEGLLSVTETGALFDGPSLSPESLEASLWQSVDVLHLFAEASWDGTRGAFHLGNGILSMDAFSRTLGSRSPSVVIWSGGPNSGAVGPELADAVSGIIPAVLSQRHRLSGNLVECYTRALYRSIGSMAPLDVAVAEAQREVSSQFPMENEWLAPALFLARKDAVVLYSPGHPSSSQEVYNISEGQHRRKLRETLNRIWPKPERYFPLQLRWMPRDEPLSSYLHAAEFLGQPQGIGELSGRFQRLLLLGEGGAGKSMALYRLFYEAAQPVLAYETKSPLPVYISLADVPVDQDLMQFLSRGVEHDLLTSDLEEGRFLFLMDSLDALSSAAAARRVDRLNDFMRRFPLNRFVVASREPPPVPVEIPNWVEMMPLAEWEAIEFLISDASMRPESANLLYRELTGSLGARLGNPQILSIARRLWREGARVPGSLTELFLAFFRVAGDTLSDEARETLLPQIAMFMSKSERLSLQKEHLEGQERPTGLNQLAAEVAFRNVVAKGADALLAEVEKTRLLRGPRAFSFPNQSFQEFLTAFALNNAEMRVVLSLVPTADWRELETSTGRPTNLSRGPFHGALPFLCGLREDGPRLVEQLVDRDPVLASQCFPEVRRSTSVDLRIRAAVERELASEDELQQRIACLALEARGDRWAVDWLERVATDQDSGARALAVEALGKLHSHRSVPVLEAAAREPNAFVARAALEALTRIRAS